MNSADRLSKQIEEDVKSLKKLLRQYRQPNCKDEATAIRLTIRSLELAQVAVDNMGLVIIRRHQQLRTEFEQRAK